MAKKKNIFDDFIKNISPEVLEKALNQLEQSGALSVPQDWSISAHDWSTTHPGALTCGSDIYYARLATRLHKSLEKIRIQPGLPVGWSNVAAIAAASYLEDVVSETGIWNSIRNLFKASDTKGRTLPFFDCDHDDYIPEEVNLEDVKFLVWQAIARCGQTEDRAFSPLSPIVEVTAQHFYDILVDEYEKAPAATRLSKALRDNFASGDFYRMRELVFWLAYDCPLTAAPNASAELMDTINRQTADEETKRIFNNNESYIFHYYRTRQTWIQTGPMGCLGSRYLADMARAAGYGELAARLDGIEVRTETIYEIVSYSTEDETMTVRDLSGELLIIDLTDNLHPEDIEGHKGYMANLVKFGDTWQLNGAGLYRVESPFGDKSIRQEITYVTHSFRQNIAQVVKHNRGRRIFYCSSQQQMEDIIGMKGTPLDEDGKPCDAAEADRETGNYVLMLSDETMPVVLTDCAGCFKDPANPYFDKETAAEDSMSVVFANHIPDDIALYIEKKNLLGEGTIYASQGKRVGNNLFRKNVRFLCGFYRTDNPCLVSDD